MSKPCKACVSKDKEIAKLRARIIAPCEECQGVGSIERIHEDRAYYDPCKTCAGGRVVIAEAT